MKIRGQKDQTEINAHLADSPLNTREEEEEIKRKSSVSEAREQTPSDRKIRPDQTREKNKHTDDLHIRVSNPLIC